MPCRPCTSARSLLAGHPHPQLTALPPYNPCPSLPFEFATLPLSCPPNLQNGHSTSTHRPSCLYLHVCTCPHTTTTVTQPHFNPASACSSLCPLLLTCTPFIIIANCHCFCCRHLHQPWVHHQRDDGARPVHCVSLGTVACRQAPSCCHETGSMTG